MSASIKDEPFGNINGQPVTLFTLENGGCRLEVLDYAGTILRWWTPDRDGVLGDIIVSPDCLDSLVEDDSGFGAVIGRCANRIAGAKFELNGTIYPLTDNDAGRGNCLHSGCSFHSRIWQAHATIEDGLPALHLTYTSPDGEGGFPGEVVTHVVYRLRTRSDGSCALDIHYTAETTQPTHVNLTNHAYFNLAAKGESVLDHVAWINAEAYTPINENMVPTGEIVSVAGTPFDFRKPKRIGEDIEIADEQLVRACGYDHNFVLVPGLPDAIKSHAATVYDPSSGRVLEVHTSEPGLQVYTGSHLNEPGVTTMEKRGPFARHPAVCLETQHFPNSPNLPNFPSTVLNPGEVFESFTEYRVTVKP